MVRSGSQDTRLVRLVTRQLYLRNAFDFMAESRESAYMLKNIDQSTLMERFKQPVQMN